MHQIRKTWLVAIFAFAVGVAVTVSVFYVKPAFAEITTSNVPQISRVVDKENGVICYASSFGFSCVKASSGEM
jgi:hypothetical protein